jgi:hypothetical protein
MSFDESDKLVMMMRFNTIYIRINSKYAYIKKFVII